MGFITDSNIHLYYTQKYRSKLSQRGRVIPTYFSLTDSEINYNFVNINDGLVDNNGMENNSVSADLDSDIYSIPVFEPNEEEKTSLLYGYITLPSVSNISNIGTELSSEESEISRFKKYIFSSQYIQLPSSDILNGSSIEIRSDVFGSYRTYFTLQQQNNLYLYDTNMQNVSQLLDLFSGGNQINEYNMYGLSVLNKDVGEKCLSQEQLRIISGNFENDARGYQLIDNPSYYPSHKSFLHIRTQNKYVILDVTSNTIKNSMRVPIIPLYFIQILNMEESFSTELFFESFFRVVHGDTHKLFRTQTPTIFIRFIV